MSSLGLLLFLLGTIPTAVAESRPDVVLVTWDAARADHAGCYGYRRKTTPLFLDALAKEGALFERAYAQAPWTAPSLATLLTSRYPEAHACNILKPILDPGLATFVKAFRQSGYRTAAFVAGMPGESALGLTRDFETVRPFWVGEPLEKIRKEVLEWADAGDPRPFLFWMHAFNSHLPYYCPKAYREQFEPDYSGPVHEVDQELYAEPTLEKLLEVIRFYNEPSPENSPNPKLQSLMARIQADPKNIAHFTAHYDGCLNYMDREFSILKRELESARPRGGIIWIASADHGEHLGDAVEHSSPTLSHPLADLHESLLRVPLLIRVPGAPKGRRIKAPVMLMDVGPTLLSLARVPIPEGMQGLDRSAEIMGKAARPARAWAYAADVAGRGSGWSWTLVKGGWKLARTGQGWELYDLSADPLEKKNRADSEPAKFLELAGVYLPEIHAGASSNAPAQ
ncbi:MAG: sulfatase [Elusimicrobia bacterium]|nr:sulfatase [Elusimicrobiota bacterium]